jgi:hypothetical protein
VIDLDAIKARLSEYDDALPRCPQKIARTINCAPDYLLTDDPDYHDYDFTKYSPCCRPEGHADECRNSRSILGWPGFETVTALVREIEHLRGERAAVIAHLRERAIYGAGNLVFVEDACTILAGIYERGEHRLKENTP